MGITEKPNPKHTLKHHSIPPAPPHCADAQAGVLESPAPCAPLPSPPALRALVQVIFWLICSLFTQGPAEAASESDLPVAAQQLG